MIDVQRDWHFQTYQRAIVKMRELVASGDEDPANYTELAGLYHYTGQYDLAAEALAGAIALSEPGETRLSMQIDRVVALASAGRGDEARALARDIRANEIPELEDKMGTRLDEARLSLADSVVVERCDLALAMAILAEDVAPAMDESMTALVDSLAVEKLDMETWRVQTDPVRDRLRWFVSSSVALLFATQQGELAQAPERAQLAAASWRWIDALAFRELDPADSPLSRYAVIGRLLEASSSDPAAVLAQIEAAPLPAAGRDPLQRGSGPEQRALDLEFVRVSPTFWSSELASLFAKEKSTLDPARVRELAARSERAREEARALGLD